MRELAVQIDVPNLPAGGGAEGHFRRVAGLLDDRETVCVATMLAGEREAQPEISFRLFEAVKLADACLAGDRRALTQPGLARILSASVAVLFRVSQAAGAIQTIEGCDDRRDDDDRGDRGEAPVDEPADD